MWWKCANQIRLPGIAAPLDRTGDSHHLDLSPQGCQIDEVFDGERRYSEAALVLSNNEPLDRQA